jgi:hypothetical protein
VASFSFVVTKVGVSLLAKVTAGAQLVFTRYVVGDGTLAEGQSAEDLTAVINWKQYVDINNISVANDYATVRAVVTNEGIETGYYMREFGILADDPDNGEILFAVSESGDQSDYLPAYNGQTILKITYDHEIYIGNATSVTITIQQELAYVTRPEFESHTLAKVTEDTVHGFHTSQPILADDGKVLRWDQTAQQHVYTNILDLIPYYAMEHAYQSNLNSPSDFASYDEPKTKIPSFGGLAFYTVALGSTLFTFNIKSLAANVVAQRLRFIDDNAYFYLNGALITYSTGNGGKNLGINWNLPKGNNRIQVVLNNSSGNIIGCMLLGDILNSNNVFLPN